MLIIAFTSLFSILLSQVEKSEWVEGVVGWKGQSAKADI